MRRYRITTMRVSFTEKMHEDARSVVTQAIRSKGMVNLSVAAEEVRSLNATDNIAAEDIEHLILNTAQVFGAAIEFDALEAFRAEPNGLHITLELDPNAKFPGIFQPMPEGFDAVGLPVKLHS